jgi:hypothetical protein
MREISARERQILTAYERGIEWQKRRHGSGLDSACHCPYKSTQFFVAWVMGTDACRNPARWGENVYARRLGRYEELDT